MTLAQGARPFGAPLWQAGSGSSGFGFTGEQVDASTGLVFLRARYYDSGTGRFLSLDPWRGDVWQPGTLNGFVYALNNPLRFVDPGGNQSCDCDELWDELRSRQCGSGIERWIWDLWFGELRKTYLDWVEQYKLDALYAARIHNLPELMGVSENEAAARMLAYKWVNYTAGYVKDTPEAIAMMLGIEKDKNERSMTFFELRPSEVDDLRNGYMRKLGESAPGWGIARPLPERSNLDSEFLLNIRFEQHLNNHITRTYMSAAAQ